MKTKTKWVILLGIAGVYLLTRKRGDVGGLGMPPPPPGPPDTCQGTTTDGDSVDAQHRPTIAASYVPGYTWDRTLPTPPQVTNPAYERCVAVGGKVTNDIWNTPQFCIRPERTAYIQCKKDACVAALQYGCKWGGQVDKRTGDEYGDCGCPGDTPWNRGPLRPAMPQAIPGTVSARDRALLQYGIKKGWIAKSRGVWYEKRYSSNCRDTGMCQKKWYRTNDPVGVVKRHIAALRRAQENRRQEEVCRASGGNAGYRLTAGAPVFECQPRTRVAVMPTATPALGFFPPGPIDDLVILNAIGERA